MYTVDVGLLYNESVTDDELVKQIVMTTFKDSVSSSLTCSYQNVLYRVLSVFVVLFIKF
jgi:hypothetical protein